MLNRKFNAIIIGAGNMGQALANYSNFNKRGFSVVGVFDIDKKLIGKKINNLKIMHSDSLEEYLSVNQIDIAILCTPYEHTRNVADKVARLGVKALWNFSPMDIKLTYDVVVENVHLSDSLMVLGYKLKEKLEG